MGSMIALIRTSRGLTQTQVSVALGISRAHYANIESGKRSPSMSLALKLARFYECSLELLNLYLRYDVSAPLSSPLSITTGAPECRLVPTMREDPHHEKTKGENRQVAIQDKLKELSSLDSFAGVGVFSPSGEGLSIVGNSSQFPLQRVGAVASTVLANAKKACEEMETGREQMVHIVTGKAHVLIRDFNESIHAKFTSDRPHPYLVLVLTSDSGIGLAKMKIASVMAKLVDEIR